MRVLARWELSVSEDNFLTIPTYTDTMPVVFHLRISTAAKHAGRTDRRVLGVRRQPMVVRPVKKQPAAAATAATHLLPASPLGKPEMATPPPTPTPRPSVDIDAPRVERPRIGVPSDIDYEEFGGASPGFCVTGKCHCGDCGYSCGSRYTSADYERDVAAFRAEEEEEEEEEKPQQLLPGKRDEIVMVLSTLVKQFAASTNEQKIELIVPLARYILDEPAMGAFLAAYPSFAAILEGRMLDFRRQLPWHSQQVALCNEVLDRFFGADGW